MKKPSVLCLIVARGKSRGIPEKNIFPIMNRPLIDYTIEAAQKAKIFDSIILSTDSKKIARRAIALGVSVPFIRPKELAGDNAKGIDAVVHALKWCESHDRVYDFVHYALPTTPLRTSQDFINGVTLLIQKKVDMVISVCPADHPMQWLNALPADRSMKNFVKPEYRGLNRQALPPSYRVNGAILAAKWKVFYNKLDWFEQNTLAYIMPKERSVDIDHPFDVVLAEALMRKQK